MEHAFSSPLPSHLPRPAPPPVPDAEAPCCDAWTRFGCRGFAAGQSLFERGRPAESVFLIRRGLVEVLAPAGAGTEVPVDFLGPGSLAGALTLFDRESHRVSARAVVPTEATAMPADHFRNHVFADPCLFDKLLSDAIEATNRIAVLTAQIKLRSTTQRLAGFLLELVAARGGEDAARLPISKGLLASHLGMTPQSLSRSLRMLRELGVAVSRDRVRIADPARLHAFCDAV